MPAVSSNIWNILYTVSRYLFPFLAVVLVLLVLLDLLSASRASREKARSIPGCGTVGELVVLSGGKNLDTNTWFPVPREGVMGSVRSCDLVIPCPGVRPKHLDFSWQDGSGLLISPRSGCEALVNGVPVTCRSGRSSEPLTHGSVLQIGSAVLRLHLFSALESTTAAGQAFIQPAVLSVRESPAAINPLAVSSPAPQAADPVSFVPYRKADPSGLPPQPSAAADPPQPVPPAEPVQPDPRLRRSDRWKEDLGE